MKTTSPAKTSKEAVTSGKVLVTSEGKRHEVGNLGKEEVLNFSTSQLLPSLTPCHSSLVTASPGRTIEPAKRKHRRTVIGLMSGTSCDGIDACLVDIIGNGIETKVNILAFETYPYDDELRKRILDVCQPETGTVDKICHLNFLLGHLFAKSAKMIAKKAGVPLTDVNVIGSHGQTIYHIPGGPNGGGGSTLQIGEPCVIAHETGVTTVADFRTRDIAAGGHGAPLVPYADFILFRDNNSSRAIQNIGGIANVTFLPKACNPHSSPFNKGGMEGIIAFDTGPGNVIIDRITEIVTNGKSKFDLNGKLASSGRINNTLLDQLLSHPYFSRQPPKTTGREVFGVQFSDKLYREAKQASLDDVDILTTVTAFTAKTIIESYKRFILPWHEITEVILSGGGSRNLFLVKLLKEYAGSILKIEPTVKMIDEFGIPGSTKEAVAFAILANETISGNPNNVPSATGAREAVVLGKIAPP